jgi:hypothetical protein
VGCGRKAGRSRATGDFKSWQTRARKEWGLPSLHVGGEDGLRVWSAGQELGHALVDPLVEARDVLLNKYRPNTVLN